MRHLVYDLKASLEELADPKRIRFAKTSYPTAMEVIGVTVPNLKVVLKEMKILTKEFSISEKLHLAKALINEHVFELQQLAFEYLDSNKKVLKSLSKNDIRELGKNLDNWLSVDYYSAVIVGFAWRENLITIDSVNKYLESEDFWIRRIALVATVSLNQKARGGLGDSEQTLEVCKNAVDDHEEMIVKAMSWALRELAKIEKEPVAEFLERYKDRLHRKVIREVTAKLETGRKN
ncbi:MAG: DNA alkylation repair protein [Bacteroidetes bacterium]|nr:DNA alkylation repair protein [Bacteroidota bacterium]